MRIKLWPLRLATLRTWAAFEADKAEQLDQPMLEADKAEQLDQTMLEADKAEQLDQPVLTSVLAEVQVGAEHNFRPMGVRWQLPPWLSFISLAAECLPLDGAAPVIAEVHLPGRHTSDLL